MKRNFPSLLMGIVLGLFLAWLLGMFSPGPPTAADLRAKSTATPAPANVAAQQTPVKPLPMAVATLATPPAKVVATTPQPLTPEQSARIANMQAQMAPQSRLKQVTNNLRQLYVAAQQYFLDKGVDHVGYYDLVGAGTDNYIRNVTPVAGEDYSGFYISQDDTQISISSASFGTVTFNL